MLARNSSSRTWLIFTILISTIVLSETEDPKKPKPSSNRAQESGEADKKKEKLGAFSSDSDNEDKKELHNVRPKSLESNSDSNEDGNMGAIHSTRGLKAEDFEPEDSKINLKANHNSDDETDGESSRRRRSLESLQFANMEIRAR